MLTKKYFRKQHPNSLNKFEIKYDEVIKNLIRTTLPGIIIKIVKALLNLLI